MTKIPYLVTGGLGDPTFVGSTGVLAPFSSGIITLTATLIGLPVGQYVLSLLPARATDHRLVLPDPLPTTIITSSINNGVNTVTVSATYNLQSRVVDF